MPSKRTLLQATAAGTAGLFALVVAVPLLLAPDQQSCTDDSTIQTGATLPAAAVAPKVNAAPVGRWRGVQLDNAASIIRTGKALGVPQRAQVIAVMTAMGESSLTVIDRGDAVGPDSRGLFQQRANGAWGSYSDRMNPTISATNFYKALLRVNGWQSMTPTAAAHATQNNADPNYYTKFYADARAVFTHLTGIAVAGPGDSAGAALTGGDCSTGGLVGAPGTISFPLPASSGYRDNHNWHDHSSLRASWHTGNDYSVACGTPILAANAGRVILRRDQPWAGPTLIQIQVGPGQLTSWYAHAQSVDVANGQSVTAGQKIGEVGALGNATGCHLHFEVHTRGGSIYGPDNTNPATWLAANVGKTADAGTRTVSAATRASATGAGGGGVLTSRGYSDARGAFRLIQLNTLGASHTNGSRYWPGAAARTSATIGLLNSYQTDVAALQEFQTVQWRAFTQQAGATYATMPAAPMKGMSTENAIIWRRSSFQLVSAYSFRIPYFEGREKRMPVVLLRQISTGKTAWFASIHNPAEVSFSRGNGGYRRVALERERTLLTHLVQSTGRPVFLAGDFNDRANAFCSITAVGAISASGGSNHDGQCRPGASWIDWIFGYGGVGFAGYKLDHASQNRRISDHPILISNALIVK